IDCGGSCGPCFVIGVKEEKTQEGDVSTGPTGAVVGAPFGNAKKYGWLVTLLIIALGLFSYYKFRKKPLQAQPKTHPENPPYRETEGTDPLLKYQK
ncbi:MAG: hypothetical protein V1859_11490, partial [archaeon]